MGGVCNASYTGFGFPLLGMFSTEKSISGTLLDWNRKRIARERRESAALWKTRGLEWTAKINGWIEEASKKGKHGTYAPSDIGPNGDQVIWIPESDRSIHKLLMEHYRDAGFNVKEYSPLGMMITR